MERRILREGVPLSEQGLADARALGVREPERVRLLTLDSVPTPTDLTLKTAVAAIQFLTPATRGLALRYGIFVRSDCWGERPLIAHELVHTAQYERLGGSGPSSDNTLPRVRQSVIPRHRWNRKRSLWSVAWTLAGLPNEQPEAVFSEF